MKRDIKNISKIVIHHSVSQRDQTIEKSIASFDNNHKKRLHKEKNSLGYHISYHFVISGDGKYKQTRGLGEVGYHASNLNINKESIGICLTGNFDEEKPSLEQMKTLKYLINKYKTLHPSITIHGHNEYASKSCPGKNLDISKLTLLLFYENLWNTSCKKIPKNKRIFKDPEAFLDRLEDLSEDEKRTEFTYLTAILAEKLGGMIEKK